ncbi:MAG: shikimate kinase [Alphaproteobacteria bacterium]|nr:shikimate kinase [Alphaproteobacteria bacterium]
MNTTSEHSARPLGQLPKPVVLVGLMGAGKSTIGRRLARKLNLEFVDSDQEIENAAHCSISDIFEIQGEAYFRELERKVIGRLLDRAPHVLATGGGAFIQEETRTLIKRNAISIWLRADLDVLVERVSRRNVRPLLEKGDKRDILSRLMEERYPIYANADIAIDSSDGEHHIVVHKIVDALRSYMS